MNNLYIQYSPKPTIKYDGNKNAVFFGQRLPNISINTIVDILGANKGIKINIHGTMNADSKFIIA